MKNFLQSLRNGIAFGMGGLLVLLLSGVTYAVWNYTTSVNSGDPLTAEMWNSLKDAVQANAVVPTGGVMAFNLASCPTGWTEVTSARGRTIIGSNPNTSNGLSVRAITNTGGEEQHTLTQAELPNYNLTRNVGYETVAGGGAVIWSSNGGSSFTQVINSGGGGAAHNTMPPFITFLYCQKN